MNRGPDFYMYRGDGDQDILDVIRACWKFETIRSDEGEEVLLVRIAPSISFGNLSEGADAAVIGLASRSALFKVGEFGDGGYAGAVVWEVCEKEKGKYFALRSIGIVLIWKEKPSLIPKGN